MRSRDTDQPGCRRGRSAKQLHQAAADALRLPVAERACRTAVLAADLAILELLCNQIDQAEQHLAAVLPNTPAGVLTTLPGVGMARASNYGAALGDPARFANADRAYRASGLVPASYESAGWARRGQGISREGNAELRTAISELGHGLAHRDPDFARYRAGVSARMKPLMAAIAVGHRAHRPPSLSCAAASPTTPPGSPSRSRPTVKGEPRRRARPSRKTAAKRLAGTT